MLKTKSVRSLENQQNFSREEVMRALSLVIANPLLNATHFYVDRVLRIVYIATPKAAFTTILQVFYYLYFGNNKDTGQDGLPKDMHSYEVQQEFNQYSSLRNLDVEFFKNRGVCHQLLFEPGWFRFGIKRNPYQRLFSSWKNKVLYNSYFVFVHHPSCRKLVRDGLIEFEDFVDIVVAGELHNPHFNPVYRPFLSSLPNLHWYDITELDSWLDDFKKHLKHLPQAASLTLPYENLSMSIGKADQFYSQSIADKVYAYYQKDFEFFGYDKDSWYQDQPHSIPLKRGADLLDDWFMQKFLQRNVLLRQLDRHIRLIRWRKWQIKHVGICKLSYTALRKLFSAGLFFKK